MNGEKPKKAISQKSNRATAPRRTRGATDDVASITPVASLLELARKMRDPAEGKLDAILTNVSRDLEIGADPTAREKLAAIAKGVALDDNTQAKAEELICDLYRFGEDLAPVREAMCRARGLLGAPIWISLERDPAKLRRDVASLRDYVLKGLAEMNRREIFVEGWYLKLASGIGERVFDPWKESAKAALFETLELVERDFDDLKGAARSLREAVERFFATCRANLNPANLGPSRDLEAIAADADNLFQALAKPARKKASKSHYYPKGEGVETVLEMGAHLWRPDDYPDDPSDDRDGEKIVAHASNNEPPIKITSPLNALRAMLIYRNTFYRDTILEDVQGGMNNQRGVKKRLNSWTTHIRNWVSDHPPRK